MPFYHISSDHHVAIEVFKGNKLRNSDDNIRASKEEWEFIQLCCAKDPNARPTITAVLQQFQYFETQLNNRKLSFG